MMFTGKYYKRKRVSQKSKVEQRIIDVLKKHKGGLSCAEIAKRIGATSKEVAYALATMSGVEYDGKFNQYHWVG